MKGGVEEGEEGRKVEGEDGERGEGEKERERERGEGERRGKGEGGRSGLHTKYSRLIPRPLPSLGWESGNEATE